MRGGQRFFLQVVLPSLQVHSTHTISPQGTTVGCHLSPFLCSAPFHEHPPRPTTPPARPSSPWVPGDAEGEGAGVVWEGGVSWMPG